MKKYSIFYITFVLSFAMYSFILFVTPYVTAQMWADVVMCVFVNAVCYQFVYLFYLRKKDNIKFGRAVLLYLLCLFSGLEMYIFLYYGKLFINGYTPTDFLGNQISDTVYGWKAIQKDGFANFIFIPFLGVCTLYQIIYCAVVMRKRQNKHCTFSKKKIK